MDVHLPVMSGVEAIRRFNAETPACVVVISAYADEETRAAAMEAGACAYIPKPLNGKDVIREIEEAYVRFHSGKRLGTRRFKLTFYEAAGTCAASIPA